MQSNIKLINPQQDLNNIKDFVLKNRGIADPKAYTTLGTKNLHDPMLFGEHEMKVVYNFIDMFRTQNRRVFILADTDVDGYCSAAMMYSYLTKDLGMERVEYILNIGKAHGLTKLIVKYLKEKKAPDEYVLLIIPDAGTNDIEGCKELSDYGYEILVIDHHEQEGERNPYPAAIINPKMKDSVYPNKNLCGAAVVWKVIDYLDEEFFENGAGKYLDLMGVAMVADIMDLRDLESRFLTTRGLANIESKFLKAIVNKNSYSISNLECPSAIDVAFYVSPYMNAVIRLGSEEEKDKLFRALIEDDRDEKFPYKQKKTAKNPDPQIVDEDLYDHMARVCGNVKRKQDKLCTEEADAIVEYLKTCKDTKLVVMNKSSFNRELIGVLANKVANLIQKPCIFLYAREKEDEEDNELPIDDWLFGGSARNFSNSYIYDFKKDVNDSGCVENALGHGNAFGVTVYGRDVSKLMKWFEDKYADVDDSKTYYVDYILDGEVPFSLVRELNEMKALYSNFVAQPYIAVENLVVKAEDIKIETASNGNKRFSFVVNDIEFVKFKLPDDDECMKLVNEVFEDEELVFDLVGKTTINMFGGKATPQLIIEDYGIELIRSNENITTEVPEEDEFNWDDFDDEF